MSQAVTVEIDGVKDVVKALKRLEDGANDLKQVHGEAARNIELDVRAPVRSGVLAASVRSTGQAGAGVIRAGRAAVPYAGPIHWGHPRRNIKAQPFLVEAAERKTPKVVQIYENGIAALIKTNHLDP